MSLPPPDSREFLPLDMRLQAELHRLHETCAELQGVAVATEEGLALCTLGSLWPEAACATASFLINQLNTHLGMLRAGRAREVLIWTDSGPWYIARIASLPYVIALLGAGGTPAAGLRHAGALAAARLVGVLASLAEQPTETDSTP